MDPKNIITDDILNTSPKEPENVFEKLPSSRERETFVELNKPASQNPDEDLVLDLGGKEVEVENDGPGLDQDIKTVQEILAEDQPITDEPLIDSGTIFLISILVFVIFIVLVIAQKSSANMYQLQKELEELKKRR